ncbi:transglycosylase SLT domain-containing protein [Stutzerimonas nitrititolerans]|uniref:transglycosylase SLT domain-containing protein n=1 Tax=Stutzerimonas nitrititolerans TaxID=2482751 RepID=UPI0028AFAB23|nr:transglycosylase SLT domain-containing protein [Stutzerimonas nitrititolerans]
MALAHDKDGFLTGQPANIDSASYARHLALLREIRADGAAVRTDISAIRKSLSGPLKVAPMVIAVPKNSAGGANDPRVRQSSQTATATPSIAPAGPGTADAPQGKNSAPALPASNRQRPATPAPSAPGERTTSQIPRNARPAAPRRADGRFASRGGDDSSAGSDKAARDEKDATSKLSEAATELGRGAGELLAGTDQVDPTLAAAKEVKDIVSPAMGLFKPLGRIFRRRPGASDAEKAADKAVPWYRRLWHELRDINKKSGKGGGFLASLMGLLATLAGLVLKFTGLGKLGRLLGGMGGLAGASRGRRGRAGRQGRRGGPAGSAGSRRAPEGGERAGGAGRTGRAGRAGSLKGLGKAMRKLPVVGGLIAGGSALYSMFGGNQTRQERFEGAGSGIGAIIGGAVGSLAGPLGTVAGAYIGDIVGEKVGSWLATVDWSEVGRSITATWDTATTWIKGAFDGAMGFVKDTWTKLTDQGGKVFSAVSDWFNEKLGIAKSALNTAATSVKDAAGRVAEGARSAVSAAKDKVVAAKDAVVSAASTAKETVVTAASNAKEAAVIQGGRALGRLDKGYRHRESFDGISGGDSLKRFGTYTNDEADRIRELKTGGFNTSANLPGGMSAATREKIEKAAIEAGHDPKEMLKIAAMESGGNSNAISSTGAIGTFQFTGQTATGVGITNRFDEDQNIAGGMRLASQNKAALQKFGLPATAENLYMMHQLGPKAAVEVISGAQSGKRIDELSAGTQDGVRKNYGAKSVTAADYIGTNRKALDDRYARVVGNASAAPTVAARASTPAAAAVPAISSAPAATPVATPVPPVPKLLAPISASAKPISYTPAAPDLSKHMPKEAPPMTTPIGSNQKSNTGPMRVEVPLSQNVGDRSIAAVATGGIGMQQLRV